MTASTSLEREAHLWIARPTEIRDIRLLASYDAVLTAEERDKVGRFRFEKDRHTSLVTRALVRAVLSSYVEVAPSAWRFVSNEYGRPEIGEPREARFLRFNLSHTNGLVVCLVSREREVGVDVEDRSRGGGLLEIADRFFSPLEVKALRKLPAEQQMDRFFLYWTLKESYIKARGMGLALPLSAFSFELDSPGSGVRVQFDPSLADDPGRWHFSVLSYGRRHAIATGVESRGAEVKIVLRETVPLRSPFTPAP